MAPLGIIAGTGFYSLATLENAHDHTVETAFGTAKFTQGTWHGVEVIFLTRHGSGHSTPPHLVNYRANIKALKDLGAEDVVAINVVGGVTEDLIPGSLLCLSDFLDFTKTRAVTFFDGTTPEGVVHTDVMDAYHPEIRRQLLSAATRANVKMKDGGVYACFEGPRFETPAEIKMCQILGADVVGMTGVPEVTLAKEIGLRYAAISLVVNPAAGLGDEPISMEELGRVLSLGSNDVLKVLEEFVKEYQ
ncbi:MAG: S-methyl-5'-thioinosine phosphorylase [Candidatus Nanopelagicales bacterium]